MFLLAEAAAATTSAAATAPLVNWHSFFFLLFALIACGFAVAVVLAQNVVHMAFYLVISLAATAALFILAGAEFLGAMQIMIYVGGTLILLVFGVMLTAQSRFVSMKTSGGEMVIAAIVAASLLGVLVWAAISVPGWLQPNHDPRTVGLQESKNAAELGLGLLGARPDRHDATQQPNQQLREGLSGYLLPFEIISVHLVVVLVGAAYLARTKRRADSGDDAAASGPSTGASAGTSTGAGGMA
jgi:NADH-quinone oxidoreductase subunit J